MALISKKNLNFWIQNNLNVLLIGHAGCGKTHTVLDAFKEHDLKYQYYSCSTLDPYVDFIGVPREVDDKETGTKVLDLVRPKQWAHDEIEALFLDEYNRSKMAVRNAVMELIQFRSINGKKFNKLRMVWAAINPDESDSDITYDVEPLDPAQKDRFHIHYEVPYQPDMEYMEKKFGETTAKLSIEWWKSLEKNIKMLVSPRRLDYAVEIHSLGGDLTYVIPDKANPKALQKKLGSMSAVEKINQFMDKNFTNLTEIKNFFLDETNYHFGINYILEHNKTWSKLLPLIPMEKFNSLIVAKENSKIIDYAIFHDNIFSAFFDEVKNMPNDSFLKKMICSTIMKTAGTSDALKEKLELNKRNDFTVSISTGKEEDYIKDAKIQVSGYISTSIKVKLLSEYVQKFGPTYINAGKLNNRPDSLLKQEAEFLHAVANRMHDYSFVKALEKEVFIAGFGRIKIKDYFAQNKSYLKSKPSHFKPILDMK